MNRLRIKTILTASVITVITVYALTGCQHKTRVDNMLPLYVGTYDYSVSDGIYSLSVDVNTGEFTPSKKIIDAQSPSFLFQSKSDVLYSVERADNGTIAAYIKEDNGQFSLLNNQLTQGASPCYIAANPKQDLIATANYSGGNISIFNLESNGALAPDPLIIAHSGRSVSERQKSPHAHWVKWSPWQPNTIYVVDLGIDKVMKHTVSADGKRVINSTVAFDAKPGAGPRHLVFHPKLKRVYILNELNNTLVVADVSKEGLFTAAQRLYTLPKGFDQHNQAGHIEISQDGKHVYTSNRGHDSIAHFRIDHAGKASFVSTITTQGNWPRFFSLLDEHKMMLVANRQTHSIVSYKINNHGGLEPTGFKGSVKWPSYVEPAKF